LNQFVRKTIALCIAVGTTSSSSDEATRAYVSKDGEGEFAAGAIIKVSPGTGSGGAVLLEEKFPEVFSTGIHYHVEADEIFYVISGNGYARFGGQDHPVEGGDVIFIPAGEDHKLFTDGTRMELLAFLDKPGLDEEFRAWHRAYGEGVPESLEQLNEIATRYGTTYKTLE